MHLSFERRPSPVGEMLLLSDEDGALRALDFGDYEPRLHELLRRYYGDFTLEQAQAPAAVTEALDRYFDGDLDAIDVLPTATGGTLFQKQVWAALRTIPAGATWSYGQLATQLGRAGSSRAVGLANGANPVAIVVPCHRVIGANGSLTGYGGGLPRKQWLLDHERRHRPEAGQLL